MNKLLRKWVFGFVSWTLLLFMASPNAANADWFTFDDGDGYLPQGISVGANDRIYVADTGNHRVKRWGAEFNYFGSFGSGGTGDGEMDSPRNSAVSGDGYIFVADTGNDRVQKFDSSGQFVLSWGESGDGDGEFDQPAGIAVGGDGHVYVADRGNHRIQVFDANGGYLRQFGGYGSNDGQLNEPWDVEVGPDGNIYVADTGNHRIQVFASDGDWLRSWGEFGGGPGQFKFPKGIGTAGNGDVYAADTENHRVQRFTAEGIFLGAAGEEGSGPGQFSHPHDVAYKEFPGLVLVADTGNHRIQSGEVLTADEQAVAVDIEWLEIGYAEGDSQDRVTQDVELPVSGPNGTTIAWTSDEPNIDSTGRVTRPDFEDGDVQVVLTATVTKGAAVGETDFLLTVIEWEQPHEQAVADDKAWLEIGFAEGDARDRVTQDVGLPAAGPSGTTIMWTSDRPDIVDATGKVTRPDADEGDADVTLTATIARGGASDEKTFVLTVAARERSDEEAVSADKAWLGIRFAEGDTESSVTENVYLPSSGPNGTTITWTSDRPDVVDPTGQVTRPGAEDGDADVTLTATIARGGTSDTKTFLLTVIALPAQPGGGGPDRPDDPGSPGGSDDAGSSGDSGDSGTEEDEPAFRCDANGRAVWLIDPEASVTGKDGIATVVITLTEEALLEAADCLEDSAGSRALLIQTEDAGLALQVNIPAEAYEFALQHSADAEVEIRAGEWSVRLPFRMFRHSAAEVQETGEADRAEFRVTISPLDSASSDRWSRWLDEQALPLAGGPVAFTVATVTGGVPAEPDAFPEWVEFRYFPKDGREERTELAAVRNDPVRGTFSILPAKAMDGGAEYRIRSFRAGQFAAAVPAPVSFRDLDGHWAEEGIERLAALRVISGTGDGRFLPDQSVTRAQFAAMLVRALGLHMPDAPVPAFADIGPKDWYAAAVRAAAAAGLVNGDESGRFLPNEPVTREQMAAMTARALDLVEPAAGAGSGAGGTFSDESNISPWASDAVAVVAGRNIMNGLPDGSFAPSLPASRAEAGVVLLRLLRAAEFLD